MNEPNYLLTFELNPNNETLEIHTNKQGLEKLRDKISALLNFTNDDHTHLMTSSWGGNELSSQSMSRDNQLINHVKIYKWDDADLKILEKANNE